MHDRTRRTICVLAFWALGVLPLLLVIAWCTWRHRPGRLQVEAERLGRQLGLIVTLDGMRDLRPGVKRYDGLHLVDAETDRTIFFASSLETAWATEIDSQGRSVEALDIKLSGGELGPESLDELGRLTQRVMEGRTGCRDPQVRFLAGEVLLQARQQVQKFSDVRGWVDSVPDKVQAAVFFRLADVVMPQLAQVGVIRNRKTTPPTTGFMLSTGDAAVPCALLQHGLPQLARLGAQSKFKGWIQGDLFAPWQGQVVGQFSGLDLESLLAEYAPHHLTGTGQLLLGNSQFRDGRLETAYGELRAGPGNVSQSLLAAAAERLGLPHGPEPVIDPAPYEQLALSFRLGQQGIELQGLCAVNGPPRAILVDRYQRMLGEPGVGKVKVPTSALVQMLVPWSDAQAPANRLGQEMLRWLPIPDAGLPGDVGGLSQIQTVPNDKVRK